jgi:hypothetical protein
MGALLSVLLLPVVAAAAVSPSRTSASTEPPNQSGATLRLGVPTVSVPTLSVPTLSVPTLSVPSLTLPLTLDLGGLLHLLPGSATSTPPTSSPPTSSGGNTLPAPPTTSHPSPTAPTRSATGGAVLPNGGGQSAGYSSSTQPSIHPTTSAPPTDHTRGTGSLVLIQRLLDNSGVLMIAALLAATALAVIALARLGGVRRGGRGPRQH